MMESCLIIIAVSGIFKWLMNVSTCNGRVIRGCDKPWESTHLVSSEKDFTLEQCEHQCHEQCSVKVNKGFVNEKNTVTCYNNIEMFAHPKFSNYQRVINPQTGEKFHIENKTCSCGLYHQASESPFELKFSACNPPISITCFEEKICKIICDNYLVLYVRNNRGFGVSHCKMKGDPAPDVQPLTGACYPDSRAKDSYKCRCGLQIGTDRIGNRTSKHSVDKSLEKRSPVGKAPVSPPYARSPSPKPEKQYPVNLYVDEKHNVHTDNVRFDECDEDSMKSLSLDTVRQETNMQKCLSRCDGLYGHYDDAKTLWCYNALRPAYGVMSNRSMAGVFQGTFCTCMVNMDADIRHPICNNILPFAVNSERDCLEICSKSKGLVVLEHPPRLANFRTTCFNAKSLHNLPLGFNIHYAHPNRERRKIRAYCKCGRLRRLLNVVAKDKRADVFLKGPINAINTSILSISPSPVRTGQIKRTRSANVSSEERKSKQSNSPSKVKELIRGKSHISVSSDDTNNNSDGSGTKSSSKPTNFNSLEKARTSATSYNANNSNMNNNNLVKDAGCSINKFDVPNSPKISDPEAFKNILKEIETRFPIETENIDFSWDVLLNSNTENYGTDYLFQNDSKTRFPSPNVGDYFGNSENSNRSRHSNKNLEASSSGHKKSKHSAASDEETTSKLRNNNGMKNSSAAGRTALRSSSSSSTCDSRKSNSSSKRSPHVCQNSNSSKLDNPHHSKDKVPDSTAIKKPNVHNDKVKTISRAPTRVHTFEELFDSKLSQPSTTQKLPKSAYSSQLHFPKNDSKSKTSPSHSTHSNAKSRNTIRCDSSTKSGVESSSRVVNYPSVNIPSKWVHINKKSGAIINKLDLECGESLADD